MICAYCGNTDTDTLWDEDDAFYCSKCYSRTLFESGELDLIPCPECGKLKDRKAYYCPYC